MDKVATQISITKTSNYQTVSTDIEAWYSNKTDEEIKTGLKTVFDAFKKEIPSCTVGNYGIPDVYKRQQICRCSSTLSLHCRA